MTTTATLLARLGWTTGELAARLDVSPDTARQWASGRREPPPNVAPWLARLADAIGAVESQPAGWTGVRVGRRNQEIAEGIRLRVSAHRTTCS